MDLSESQDEVAAEEVMQAARAARGRRAALLAALPAARADIEACDAVAAAAREHAAKVALETERQRHRAELEGAQARVQDLEQELLRAAAARPGRAGADAASRLSESRRLSRRSELRNIRISESGIHKQRDLVSLCR